MMSGRELETAGMLLLLTIAMGIAGLTTTATITGLAPHSQYPDLYSAAHDTTIDGQTFTATDTAVYKQGWYSIDSGTWQAFTLQGAPYTDSEDWLATTATATLPSSILNQGEHYIITYTCTYNNGWDCHGGKWQLLIIDNEPNCVGETTFACHLGDVYWYDSCGNVGTIKEGCEHGCEDDECLPPPETCFDGVQNQDEEGVDCGGTVCEPCEQPMNDVTYAINAGGDSYTASDGTNYEADDHYTSGNPYDRGGIPVSNTLDDYLYSTERWGEFSYSFPVTNNDYEVTLKFMEGYLSGPGERIFDVKAEGNTVIDDLDIYEQAGRDAAHDKAFTITVNDGALDLSFEPTVQYAQIGAILIKTASDTPTCNDRKQNGDETGVDCGGSCPDDCLEIPIGETTITLDYYGLEETGEKAHIYLKVNGREHKSIYAPTKRQTQDFTIPLPRSAIDTIQLEFDNLHVWDDSGSYRNIYLYGMQVGGEPVDIDGCDKDEGIWRSGDKIIFGLNGEMSCDVAPAQCTPDCNNINCGESRNNCGSCGGCTAEGTCLVGYCVTGPSRLKVSGNKLINDEGEEVVLKGFNYIDQGDLAGGDWDRGDRVELDFAEMERWNANSVRHIIHSRWDFLYAQDPDLYVEKYLDREISLAAKHGMYSIIDYHDFYMYEAHDTMMDFWEHMASRYAGYEHVIYELFNEPHDGEWEDLLALYHEAIDIIRSYDPDALIIANGLQWGYDLHYVHDKPVDRPNIAYGTHPYPGKVAYCNGDVTCMRNSWDYKYGDVSEHYPVIVTEVGWIPDGSGREWDDSTERFGEPFFDYLNEKGIGYSIMSFTTGYFMEILETLEPDYIPGPEGQFVKDDLANN
ncbi:cellulase family glycosylhydrolase [Candidatus Woesearchaeota archaeon]|nr:cellulase family glycosylhydrolase [Candidatus Woesearchaeota archaeon]